jgi:beta-lactamase regulating signal transducer with metallopeptidase domain
MLATPMVDLIHAALASGAVWLTAFAQAAAPAAVATLWQGAIVALVLGLSLRAAPRLHLPLGAAQRFAVWAVAFAAIAGLPFLPSLARGPASQSAANAALGASAPAPWFQLDGRWALAIAALWLTVSLVRAAALVIQTLDLRRLWRSARPVAADPTLSALLAAASPARRAIELCTTRELDRPSVIGFFAPRILIPDWLFARLTPAELEHVVLHEAEHLRRRDDWTNLLQKLALVLFPLNPALVWIERRLSREREMACDEGVVRRTQAPRAYAASLASLAERGLERRGALSLSLGAFERRSELVRRVSTLLARKPALHPAAARVLVGFAACGLLAASVELARAPRIVAFVPAIPAATAQNRLAQADLAILQGDGNRVLAEPSVASGDSSFRAIHARAIVPSKRAPAPSSSRRYAAQKIQATELSGREAVLTQIVPHAVLSSVEIPGTDRGVSAQLADAAHADQPQLVVLTAWEDVVTSPRRAAIVADYEIGAPDQSQSTDSRNQAANQTVRPLSVEITVTRLVFLLAPRPNVNSSVPAPNVKALRPTASDPRQPPAPPPGSGWLVLEL